MTSTAIVLCACVSGLAIVAAGCGETSASPGVASLGSAASTATTQSRSAVGLAHGGPSGGNMTMQLNVQTGAKFAACMRAHGVSSFPDPNSQGAIQIGPSSGIDPSSPKFRTAQQACQKLLPNGGQPTPAQIAKMQRGALAFSACMRRHGVTDFPDPTFSGGGVGLKIRSRGGASDLNPSSATLQAAQKACRGNFRGAGAGAVPGK